MTAKHNGDVIFNKVLKMQKNWQKILSDKNLHFCFTLTIFD